MNLKRLANLFAIALISAATLTACGEDDVIDKDDPTIADDTTDPDKDDPTEPTPDEGTDSSEELKVALLTDYVKDSDTFFFSNGVAINVSQDEETEGYYLFIDSLSFETGEWVEGKDLMAYCDPELRPICVANAAGDKLFFTYADNNTFSITYANANGEMEEHTGIQMPEPAQSTKTGTRASTDTDYLPYLGNGLTVLDTGLSIIEKDWKSTKLNIASLILAFTVDGLTGDMASLALSEIAVNVVKTGALGYAGLVLADIQAVQHAIEWRIKIEIGDVTPRITALEVEGENTVNVSINISNFVANTKSIPLYYVKYWQEVDGKRVGEIHQTGTKEITKEGDIIEPVTNLSSGTYAFQVIVYPSSFISDFIIKIYNFRSNVMRAEFLSLYPKVLQESTEYGFFTLANKEHWYHTQTNMQADINCKTEQDRDELATCQDYGVYILLENGQINFYSTKTGPNNKINFWIPRENYTLDYENYIATASIKMGAYTVKSGSTTRYNEQEVEIVYDEFPSVRVTTKRDGYFEYSMNGALWIDYYITVCDGVSWDSRNNATPPVDYSALGNSFINPYVTATSEIYFDLYLTNGKTITWH